MKYLFWVAVLMSSCTRSPNVTRHTAGTYAGVLPIRNGSVYYHRAAAKPGVTPVMADSRTRAWFRSSGRALGTVEEKPLRRKSDLLYLASLPARRVPADSSGEGQTLPPLQFWVTIDNTGDSTRVYATNFEVMDRRGNYQPLEKQTATAQPMWVSMWLGDVDAAVTTMLESLTARIAQPADR